MWRREEIAWAAGLYEGEGSCHARYGTFLTHSGERRDRKSPTYVLQIGMVDLEPLERFRDAVGAGRITGPYQGRNPGWQPHYRYWIGGYEKVQAVLAMLYPWLSPRRREQAARTLRGETNSVQVTSPTPEALRHQPEGGGGVRGEDAQGQEAA